MKETGIIMSGNHPKLILDGTKTQTRRVIKPQPSLDSTSHDYATAGKYLDGNALFYGDRGVSNPVKCPYGQVGDRLWVRETWKYMGSQHDTGGKVWIGKEPPITTTVKYAADGAYKTFPIDTPYKKSFATDGNQPSIFMPRWASRIERIITLLRVERLRDISPADAQAEGGYSVDEFIEVFLRLNHLPEDADPWNWVIGWRCHVNFD